jgi:hypothetical protein
MLRPRKSVVLTLAGDVFARDGVFLRNSRVCFGDGQDLSTRIFEATPMDHGRCDRPADLYLETKILARLKLSAALGAWRS